MSRDDTEQSEEPDRVWEVSCQCGYSEKFRWKDDALEVFEAHSSLENGDPRCGSGEMKAMHAYEKGGVDAEKTLPKDLADLSDVRGAEVIDG